MATDMQVWWQGPFYPELGQGVIKMATNVGERLRDPLIQISDCQVKSASGGSFVWGRHEPALYSESEKNAIHTFAVARKTIEIYQEHAERAVRWHWHESGDCTPLSYVIDIPDIYCGYSRKDKCIEMGVYSREGKKVYNCLTVDLVTHETGHAILDGVKPRWKSGGIESRGLSEAFADIMSMTWILNYPNLIAYFMAEAGDELKHDNMLSLFAPGHGFQHMPRESFRTANNFLVYGSELLSPYDYSSLLTGLLYDLLIDMYHHIIKSSGENPVRVMHSVGEIWAKLIIRSMLRVSDDAPGIQHFADQLLQVADPWICGYFTKHLNWRKILL